MVAKVESTEEIEKKMRIAGRLAASVLEMIEDHITPGVSTEELNKICHDYIVDDIDCIPAPLNYGGGPNQIPFPKSMHISQPSGLSWYTQRIKNSKSRRHLKH